MELKHTLTHKTFEIDFKGEIQTIDVFIKPDIYAHASITFVHDGVRFNSIVYLEDDGTFTHSTEDLDAIVTCDPEIEKEIYTILEEALKK